MKEFIYDSGLGDEFSKMLKCGQNNLVKCRSARVCPERLKNELKMDFKNQSNRKRTVVKKYMKIEDSNSCEDKKEISTEIIEHENTSLLEKQSFNILKTKKSVNGTAKSCSKTFSEQQNSSSFQPNQLKIEKQNEKKTMNFECLECNKRFSKKEYARLHYLTFHNGNQPLKMKAKVHEKVENHKCKHCGKLFAIMPNLMRHEETIHDGIKRFKCEMCDAAYTEKRLVISHVKKIHKVVEQVSFLDVRKGLVRL